MFIIQILSQDTNLGKKLKQKVKDQYKVFFSKSIYYTIKNIKEHKVNCTLIDLTHSQLRNNFYAFTKKSIHKSKLYKTVLFFLSPIELSNDQEYLTYIHKYPYQDQFWWSHSGDYETFLNSLDFFVKKNIKFLKASRENLLLKVDKKNFLSLEGELLESSNIKEPPASFLFGNSKKIRECRSRIYMACKTDATMLLIGESGSEQKKIARYIHLQSYRKKLPFSYVNLHQIPDTMHYQKLFGHIHSNTMDTKIPLSITDQTMGTLFIDGIESLPWYTQEYFLKAMHNQDLLNKKSAQLKLILSINKDINFLLDTGLLRQDLISKIRINVIKLPNLKERKSDLIYLIDQYILWYKKRYNKEIIFSIELKLALINYHWPKNIDSLYICLDKLLTISNSGICDMNTLKLIKQQIPLMNFIREDNSLITPSLFSESTLQGFFQPELMNVEKLYIKQVLKTENNNIAKTARILGISRKTLYSKLKIYKLKVG